MTQEAPSQLLSLILSVKEDEQRFGYATKQHLIAIAEYVVHNYGKYTKEEYTNAIILLAHYHMANLADHTRGTRLIAAEQAKAYEARCSHCGAVISSRKSLATGLGIICRKKLGIDGKKRTEEAY